MNKKLVNLIGDFSVFGFSQNPNFSRHTLPEQLGVKPKVIDFNSYGHFFYYSTYADVAETAEAVVLKLGLLHSAQRTPLSAQALLDQQLITPTSVRANELRGNALIVCFSKTDPRFSAYKTVMSMPQLYFSSLNQDGPAILCSDDPKAQLALREQVELNQEAVVQHFLFRFVLGRHSHFKDIDRLLSGELFLWNEGAIRMEQRRDYRLDPGSVSFDEVNAETVDHLFNEISSVMGAYIDDARQTGYDFGNMLSGGVDSSVVQLGINEHVPQPNQRHTFSYAVHTPAFEFEIDHAREASQLLHTNHAFYHMGPEDYPDLLTETIETLTYPTPSESYACKLGLAKFLKENFPDIRYFFPANGADSSHGTSSVRKVATLERFRRLPASSFLRASAGLLQPLAPQKAHGLRAVAGMLTELNNPEAYNLPVNSVSVYSDVDTARRAFGDDALKRAFGYRRYLESLYLDSPHPAEKMLMVGMVTDAYECGVTTNLIHLAHATEQIYPFMDEDIVAIALAFDPEIRLLRDWEVKPLLKDILRQRSLGSIAEKPKGPSVFSADLYDWMKSGPLRDMVLSIDRPGFLSQKDFEQLIAVPDWDPLDEPNWFLWNLLTFDIFQKQVIKQ